MRRLALAAIAGFVLGFTVAAVGGLEFGSEPNPVKSGLNSESPPYSVSKSGGDCLELRPHAGWVHEVAVGDSFAVTLNATVVHDRGKTIEVNVSRLTPGTYRIGLRTVPEKARKSNEGRKKSPPEGCQVATNLRLGTSLPTDYQQFEVTVDNRTVLTVENEDTTADFYRLPNPVNASQ